jgi:hypothetical protein
MARKLEELALDAELSEIKNMYELINPADIALFLRRKPHIVELLKEAQQKLMQFFPDARVTLERFTNANEENGDCQMLIMVYPPEEMQEINATVGKFKADWQMKASSSIKGNFCIDYEHPSIPPLVGIWDDLIGTVEMPEDWSMETDHYIYGTPKRYSKVENGG